MRLNSFLVGSKESVYDVMSVFGCRQLSSILIVLLPLVIWCTPIMGYAQLHHLHMTSYKVASYSILHQNVTIRVNVVNDSAALRVISGQVKIYQRSEPLVCISTSDIAIPRGATAVDVNCHVARCADVSVFRLIRCLFFHDINEFTADVVANIRYLDSPPVQKEKLDIQISKYIKR